MKLVMERVCCKVPETVTRVVSQSHGSFTNTCLMMKPISINSFAFANTIHYFPKLPYFILYIVCEFK